MIHEIIKRASLFTFLVTNINAELIPVYDNWINNSYASSKNSIMAGATTATAKGSSALLTNPAGLASHSNITLYTQAFRVDKLNDDDETISSTENISMGLLYNSIGLEARIDDYVTIGGGYGLETKYGLFSIGLSHLFDLADMNGNDMASNKEFATGSYTTAGVMWQKSFVGENRYIAFYFGLSRKSYGKYDGDNSSGSKLIYTSPKKDSYGVGIETNIYNTSVLYTLDVFEEVGQTLSLKGTSYGAKWLITEKFALAVGMSKQNFSGGPLKGIDLIGTGVEVGFYGIQANVAGTQRKINAQSQQNNLIENAIHIDLAFVY